MSHFNPAMLTASPEPETPPSPTHDQLMMDDPVPEESPADHINHAWSLICETLHSCALTVPDAKEELLEDQEIWMRDWCAVLEQMNECFGCMQDAQVELTLDEQGTEALEDGKKEYHKLDKLVKERKVKVSESLCEKSVAPTNDAKAPVPTEKEASVADTWKEVTDMGVPRFGGRMSTTREKCMCCQKCLGLCDRLSGVQCSYCVGIKQGCSFSKKTEAKTKPQARTRAVLPHGAAPSKKVCTESMSSAQPTVPITANDGNTSGEESEVEMQVEIQDRSGEKGAEDVAGEENFVIQHLVCYTCGTSAFDPKGEASAAKV
ncbi:uncharacterized protein F5891DRAFT_1180323 [Suillus fuscotomentosus]|uniref:Uncharacterized protein n=1 Tax=Suillus fuscotomentosus TaxID=1912939 RepID=A0AAD4EM79_9AGAM|nr:uncharacterized protein F5891DRAFT_1180323 [Suillus fuscotomentosus]KAG1908769.1 hypothetical protein F5891DRAFT_1180323 [Suillus fuscotomentosus]